MVSTRVGMDGLETTGAGHGAIAIPTSPGLAQDGGLGAGPQRGTPGPAARRSRRRARRSGLLGSATRHRRCTPTATFSRPAPALARSLASSLAGTAPATSKLHQQAKRARTCPATTPFSSLVYSPTIILFPLTNITSCLTYARQLRKLPTFPPAIHPQMARPSNNCSRKLLPLSRYLVFPTGQ